MSRTGLVEGVEVASGVTGVGEGTETFGAYAPPLGKYGLVACFTSTVDCPPISTVTRPEIDEKAPRIIVLSSAQTTPTAITKMTAIIPASSANNFFD